MNTIATVTGKLTLTLADSPAIDLGNININAIEEGRQ